MSLIPSAPLFTARNSRSGYQIENSLRFRGAQTLDWTPTLNRINADRYTLSFWVKRGGLGSSGGGIAQARASSSAYEQIGFAPTANTDTLRTNRVSSGAAISNLYTLALYRDPSAWMHVVYSYDSTQASSIDRGKFFVNGIFTPHDNTNPIDSSQNSGFGNPNAVQTWGRTQGFNDTWFEGYLAEIHVLDGTAVSDASDFGEFNVDGVWVPKEVTGVFYGNNGYYLDFSDPADIGADRSGNGNDFTPTGFTTSGTGTDVMDDTPTTNWCTLNPVFNTAAGSITSNANLNASFSSDSVTGTFGPASGKWYFEVTVDSITTNAYIGIADQTLFVDTSSFSYSQVYVYLASAVKGGNGSTSSYGATYGAGDVIGVAYDLDAGSITFYKNGTSQGVAFNSGFGSGYNYRPFSFAQGGGQTFNFGQRFFLYPPGSSSPTTAFNTVLYTGSGGTQSITGVGFQPDLVWMKKRNTAYNHALCDSVRGTAQNTTLASNLTDNEAQNSNGYISSFDSNGFTASGGSSVTNPNQATNQSGDTYVAWCWNAGDGSPVTNTDGTIQSTVKASPENGFSIVSFTGKTYTGDPATDTGTVGHGLGVAPSFYIVKARNGTSDWICYHSALGNTKYIELSQTNIATTQTGMWASTSPTSTVFTMGPFWPSNIADGKTMIAYCFAEVESYSKFGSYTGNANADGMFVYCGFRPAWVLIKVTDIVTTNWIVFDSVRQTYNVIGPWLMPSSASEEFDSDYIDFLSNGFKLRGNNNLVNGSGTYIFAAFAEHPFGGSNVSPATAR